MQIIVSPNNPIPLYQQIVDQVKSKILSGELKAGDTLPSIRQLAEDLLASVITTKRAYSELEAAGLIITRPGLGTFVADLAPAEAERIKAAAVAEHLEQAVRSARVVGISDDRLIAMLRDLLGSANGGHEHE